MQLTKHTDYALRVLLYLVTTPEATIGEIAEHYQISRNHLVKVVHALGCKGFIVTTRGKNGGIRLARPADEISVGDVVRRTEPNFDVVECFNFKRAHCVALPTCGLKSALNQAAEQFLNVLDGYTLADGVLSRDSLPTVRNQERSAAANRVVAESEP